MLPERSDTDVTIFMTFSELRVLIATQNNETLCLLRNIRIWTLVKKMEVNNPVLLGLLDEEVGQCGTTWASSKLGGKPVSVLDLFFDKVVGNCRQFRKEFGLREPLLMVLYTVVTLRKDCAFLKCTTLLHSLFCCDICYLLSNFDKILWLKRQSNLVLDSDKRHYEYYY